MLNSEPSLIESKVIDRIQLSVVEYEFKERKIALSDYIFFQSELDLYTLKSNLEYTLSLVNNSLSIYKECPIEIEYFNANRKCEMNIGYHSKYNPNKDNVKRRKYLSDGYVYLIHDRSSNCYKIGFSKTPEIRERTLQSECISIKMIHLFKGSREDESNLHKIYKNYRVRGEWFKFPDNILYEVIDYYLSKK